MNHNHCDHGYVTPPPPHHPFIKPNERDSYGYTCCGHEHDHHPDKYPVSGPLIGNAFVLKDTNPYLLDSTFIEYGQTLCFSESIYTKVTQRKDPSCINLSATFDMTDTMLTNTVRNDFLEKNIAKKYSALNGVLPIIKHGLKFFIYYTITNMDGGIEHEGVAVSYSPEARFHFTDIRDVMVTSARNVVIENIPNMTYQGMYTITIDRVEVYAGFIDVASHIEDDMNPYYSFTDNNMKIKLNSSVISTQKIDDELLIAECHVNKSFDYRSNLTTRLRISFVAFMSYAIASGNTVGIWESLYSPTEEMISNISSDIATLQDEVKMLKEIIEHQNLLIQKLHESIDTNTNSINTINDELKKMKEIDNNLEERVYALEQIPRAIRRYHPETEYVTGQLVWMNPGVLYQVSKDFTSQSGDNEIDCMDIDITTGNLTELKVNTESVGSSSPMSVTKYKKGSKFSIGQLVYMKSGEIYQVTNEYTSTTDSSISVEEAFQKDIDRGNLKPIVSSDVSILEEKVNDNSSMITELKTTIDDIIINKVGSNDSVQSVIDVSE